MISLHSLHFIPNHGHLHIERSRLIRPLCQFRWWRCPGESSEIPMARGEFLEGCLSLEFFFMNVGTELGGD